MSQLFSCLSLNPSPKREGLKCVIGFASPSLLGEGDRRG
jgi:hypothetical protein